MRHLKHSSGFTLIELLIVIGMIGILVGIAGGTFPDILRSWRLKDAANQVLEDVRDAQNEAMRIGDYASIDTGTGARRFRQQGVFLVIDVANRSYEAQQWVDDNNDGTNDPEDNNGYPDITTETTSLFTRSLPTGINFGSGPATKDACDSTNTVNPGSPDQVTFGSSGYQPYAGKPSIRFDAQGTINDAGNIYLTDGNNTWAINSLAPGFFRLCRWNGSSWN